MSSQPSELNTEWALTKLREFRSLASVHYSAGTMGGYYLDNPKDRVQAGAQVAEQILDRVIPGWRTADWPKASREPLWRLREATVRAIAQLEAQEELEANLGAVGPKLAASGLHPWVWGSISGLWGSGHYREAVGAAARAINAQAQAKLDRRDASESNLLGDAFSINPPTEGHPRLRLGDDDGGETFKNVHEGAAALARGLYRGVRNPLAHDELPELDEDQALEYVAAFSILARWVDSAKVERA